MTKEEIINEIESILEELNYSDAVSYLTQNDRKWLKETIKALEQEPCEDAISRAEAIWIASGYCHFANIPTELEKLPSVQPEQNMWEWIPVSERLPEEKGWYRCTIIVNALPRTMELFYKNGKWVDNRRIDMFNTYDIYGYGCTNEKHKLSYQELISEFDWTEEVVAWMPLPTPYESKESEGEECR